jgi:predicted Zn finger-like uncharacterized protein
MLTAQCPNCQAAVKVREALIGRTVRCPKCHARFRVTDINPEPVPPAPAYYELPPDDGAKNARLIAVSVSVGLLLLSAVLIAVHMARQPRGPREPDRRPQVAERDRLVRQAERPDDIDYRRAEEGARVLGRAFGNFCAAFLFWCVLVIALMIWIARDCRNRGDDNNVLWMGVVFLFGPIGLAIYLAARRHGPLVTCDHCHNRKLIYAVHCPHCGIRTDSAAL